MFEVAVARGAGTGGLGALAIPDLDQVPEQRAGPVPGGLIPMITISHRYGIRFTAAGRPANVSCQAPYPPGGPRSPARVNDEPSRLGLPGLRPARCQVPILQPRQIRPSSKDEIDSTRCSNSITNEVHPAADVTTWKALDFLRQMVRWLHAIPANDAKGTNQVPVRRVAIVRLWTTGGASALRSAPGAF
jgi:hypothetical protein